MPGVFMASHPTGTLSIGGNSLHTHAWNAPDLSVLWDTADKGGDDIPLGLVGGARAFARIEVPTSFTIRLVLAGECDKDGNLYGYDPIRGLWANWAALRAFTTAPVTGAGTRSAVYTAPDGSTITRNVHCTKLRKGPMVKGVNARTGFINGAGMRATLHIEVPRGGYVS